MKTLLQKCALFCLGLISIGFFSCKDKEQKNEDIKTTDKKVQKKLTALTEDIIDLERHPVNADYGNLRISLSRYTIHVDSAKPFAKDDIETIHKDGINNLKSLAMALAFNNNYSGRYLLAVKINYGLNSSKDKMKLYYQPVLLKNITNGTQTVNVVYEPEISETIYEYDTSHRIFSAVEQSTAEDAANNYTAHIAFKRNDNRYYRTFKNTTEADSTGDVKSIIYSIQEMDSIIIGNKIDEIHILNAAEEMVVSGKSYLKHSLLLGPGRLKGLHPPIFYLKYGNLSHLCPPNCASNHYFNLK